MLLSATELESRWRLDLSFGSLSIERADAGGLALFHIVKDGARTIATVTVERGGVTTLESVDGP